MKERLKVSHLIGIGLLSLLLVSLIGVSAFADNVTVNLEYGTTAIGNQAITVQPAYGGSWGGKYPGVTNGTGVFTCDIPAGYTKIRVTINQGSVQVAAKADNTYDLTAYPLTIQLQDHTEAVIVDSPGGKVDQGGGFWQAHGFTGDALTYGEVVVYVFPGTYKFRVTYNYTSRTQRFTVGSAPHTEVFKTQLATVTLKTNCTDLPLDGAKVRYAAGSWRNFGTTGVNGTVTKELFPGNRKIRLTYNYRTNTITHDLATPFDFKTVAVTLFGVTNAKYAGGSWRKFTLPTMDLLPGNYKFRLNGVTKWINVNGANCVQICGFLRLLDQNNNGVAGGKAGPAYGGSWGTTYSGQTDANGRLFICDTRQFTKIKMTVNQGGQEQTLAQLAASNYTWDTVPLLIELRDNLNQLITTVPGGTVRQGGGYWYTHGHTGDASPHGKFTVQVFPNKTYKFAMNYNHTSQTKYPVVGATGATVTFQTGKVTVNCTGNIQLAFGSWHTYTPDTVLQLLPGTYRYQGACGNGTITVTAGGSFTIP